MTTPRSTPTLCILYTAVGAAVAAAAVTALLVNIFERKQEARNPFFRVVELTDETEDPEIWGKNFPLQYDGYRRTVDQVRTRYGGSEAVPRTPTERRSAVDRGAVAARGGSAPENHVGGLRVRDRLSRGARATRTCWTTRRSPSGRRSPSSPAHACTATRSVYVPYKKLGGGDLVKGFERMNQMPYAEARKLVSHPVTCIDCHDPNTMQLRVTRPGFIEGIRTLKASQGTPGL